MRPIPVAFHIGPLEVHTYGIGLALTFWFGFVYFERRLRKNGYPTDWLVPVFLWIILAAVVGARAMHVLSNLSTYAEHPGDILAVWQGGLSSFGGLLLAVPVGVILTRRRCPELPIARALDLAVPVLLACWAMGRLLGPQLMVAGGGHPTHQWFGMYYADQVGRRLPVPIFQALEDFAVYLILIAIERRLDRWPDGTRRVGYPSGIVLGTGDGALGHRTFPRRASVARRGRAARLGSRPAGGRPSRRRRPGDPRAHEITLAGLAPDAPRPGCRGARRRGRATGLTSRPEATAPRRAGVRPGRFPTCTS